MVGALVSDKTFADLLTGLRKARGLERSVLAEKAKIAYESIRRYEEGKRTPTYGQVKKLAAVLGELSLRPLMEAAGYEAEEAASGLGLDLPDDEVQLLTIYRSLPEGERPLYLRMGLRGVHRDNEDDATPGQ